MPNSKFEDGEADVEFFDNAKRQWKRVRAWYGTFLENAVQGIARDLLAAALLRAEARGWSTVFHCHDELVIEAPEGTLPDAEVLAMLKEPPVWAIGLPLNGKVHRGPTYLEAPATREPPEPETEQELVEHAVDAFVATTPPNPNIAKAADEDFLVQPHRHGRAALRLRHLADDGEPARLLSVPRRPATELQDLPGSLALLRLRSPRRTARLAMRSRRHDQA